MGFYGIHNVKEIDEATILKLAKEYNIPEKDSYIIDTTYFSYLYSLDTTKYQSQINNHSQPLQALYYSRDGNLQSFHINCFAGGFPNFKWNKDDRFNTFLPKQAAPLDSILPLETQLKYLKPLYHAHKFSRDSFDYVVVVYWNKFTGRQSKRLIQLVQDNAKLSETHKVKIIYVNNDRLFAMRE
jgi:hypothetical protein